MKSERLIALILVLAMALSFVSCGEIKYVTIDGSDQQTDSEENPSDNQKPVEDEKQPDDQEKDPETNDSGNIENQPSDGHKTIYIYSIMSKTIHLPGCHHIDRINEDYKKEFEGDITELLLKKFELCDSCFPTEDEEEEPEEEPEEENKVSKDDATFVINSNSNKLHDLECRHIEGMNEENIKYTDLTLEELIALDTYIPCGTCLPDEYEEYKEKHGISDKK